jgi:hypothetical protein
MVDEPKPSSCHGLARLIAVMIGLAVAGTSLTGCVPSVNDPNVPTPVMSTTPTASAYFTPRAYPRPVDSGPEAGASGSVRRTAEGSLIYTVASGDSASMIADRFGVDPAQIETLKGAKVGAGAIYPEDQLTFGTRGYT